MIGFEQHIYVAVEGDVNTIHTIRVILVNGSLNRNVDVHVFTEPDTSMGMFTTVYAVLYVITSDLISALCVCTLYTVGTDYLSIDQDLTFSQGDAGFDVYITIVGDNILEGVEQFFGHLETSDPDVMLMPGTTIIEIQDSGGKCYVSFPTY